MTPQSTAIATPDGTAAGLDAQGELLPQLQPQHVRVLALDDDVHEWCRRIQETLGAHGIQCTVVNNLTEFARALQLGEYEVASIDWELERTSDEGDDEEAYEALALLRERYPEIGRVVFSVHAGDPATRREAEFHGADKAVEKEAVGDNQRFVDAVLETARLCFLRRIASRLRGLGAPADGEFQQLSDDQERLLLAQARAAVVACFWAGEEDRGLMGLLKRRGAWRGFNAGGFVKKPFHAKLAELLGYVGVTPAELTRILEVDADLADIIYKGEESPPLDIQTRRHVQWLGSILAYVLEVSKDEPELMPEIWEAKDLYRESRAAPPWDAAGLHHYLLERGREGIAEALTWIRKY